MQSAPRALSMFIEDFRGAVAFLIGDSLGDLGALGSWGSFATVKPPAAAILLDLGGLPDLKAGGTPTALAISSNCERMLLLIGLKECTGSAQARSFGDAQIGHVVFSMPCEQLGPGTVRDRHKVHLLLSFRCSQMPTPSHHLHRLLRLPCWQMPLPPQVVHCLRRRPCSQIALPPQCLHSLFLSPCSQAPFLKIV